MWLYCIAVYVMEIVEAPGVDVFTEEDNEGDRGGREREEKQVKRK